MYSFLKFLVLTLYDLSSPRKRATSTPKYVGILRAKTSPPKELLSRSPCSMPKIVMEQGKVSRARPRALSNRMFLEPDRIH